MKLSTAILLGSIGSEQGFGHLSGHPNATKTCGIGAALLAVGKDTTPPHNPNPITLLMEIWPWTSKMVEVPAPVKHYIIINNRVSVRDAIWILNDFGHWTRPQIAAWIASIEPQELEYKPLLTPTSCEQECKA